jgi:hypothetical protein
MANDRKALESLLLTRLMRLNATVQGIVTGIVAGLGIFIATNWLIIKGGPVLGPHLALLGQFSSAIGSPSWAASSASPTPSSSASASATALPGSTTSSPIFESGSIDQHSFASR